MEPFTPEPSGYENLNPSAYAEKLLNEQLNHPIPDSEIRNHIRDFSGKEDDDDLFEYLNEVNTEYSRRIDQIAKVRKAQQEMRIKKLADDVDRIWPDGKY